MLWMAVYSGHTKTVKLLLDKGANVDAANKSNGTTLLDMASKNGHSETEKLLRDAGAK